MGDHLYKLAYRIYPDLAVILTRVLLESDYNELSPLLMSESLMVTKLNSITSTFPAVQPTKFWDSNKSYLAEEFPEVQENQQSGYEFDSGITSALPQQSARIPQVSSVASLPRFPFPPASPSHIPAVHGPQTIMSHQSVPTAIEDDSAALANDLKVVYRYWSYARNVG